MYWLLRLLRTRDTLQPTCDPHVFIEEQRDGYVRYRNKDGRRWEVLGKCIDLGFCYQGAKNPKPERDCPITPEFKNCCPFVIKELDNAD